MIPYIHIGPLELGTFGLMMWLAFVVAYFVLERDIRRRNLRLDPTHIVAYSAIMGVIGAKLYHVLESPADLLAHPAAMLFSRTGFAWFGGFLAVIATLAWLARRARLPIGLMLDVCAPAAAVGYAIGRIGCLLSGDGDYGRPTSLPWGISMPNGLVPTTDVCTEYGWPATCGVHPTPIYEFAASIAIAVWLWRRRAKPLGQLTGEFLLLSGLSRFLVEFIRINPRSVFGVFSNAQLMGLLSMVAGAAVIFYARHHATRPTLRKVSP